MDSIRKQVTDNLEQLLDILPPRIKNSLELCGGLEQLVEIVMDLGRLPEARYFDSTKYLTDDPITKEDLAICVKQVGAVYGTIAMIRDLVETGKSILLLGKPGMGKTTALREIARVLADDLNKRVVIIDSSNEIAGDGDIPHPAIGRARRMQVSQPELQHQVMIEAVENHMPEVIVIDEIGTELEALAARTIAERGVQLVGTAHGNQLANLIKNPTLSDLIGGIQSVTLGDEEMRRRGLPQKSILERKAQPTFDIAVEMWERYRWAVHSDVAATIDMLLRDRDPGRQIRSVNDAGEVTTTDEKPKNPEIVKNPVIKGWRASGRMKPIPLDPQVQNRSEIADLTSKLNSNPPSDNINEEEEEANELANVYGAMQERFGTLYVYLYGVSRHQTEQVIQSINLPIEITKDLDEADIVLALRSQIRTSSKVRQVAEARQIPIHAIKTSTLPQINRALRRILHIDESPADTITDLNMFAYGDSEDEIEALEETRLAVEQIVIPKGQPVELLPRSSIIRRMQHELVEHYQLRSESYGSEPNRRLRIFPNS